MECTNDTTPDAGSDPLQQSVATGWAAFLAAQHCTREVDALRRSLNEHIKQTSTQHELLSVAVVQYKSNTNPLVTPVTEAGLGNHLKSLRQEMTESMSQLSQTFTSRLENHLESLRQEMTESMSELSQRVTSHEERAEHLRSLTSDDIKTVQEKYLSALGMVEYLQGELRDMRSDKTDIENKLTTLERQIAALPQPPTPLPDETVGFINQLTSHRADLMRILNLPYHEGPTPLHQNQVTRTTFNPEHATTATNPLGLDDRSTAFNSTSSTADTQVNVPVRRQSPKTVSTQNQSHIAVITRKQPKRKAAEPPQTQPNPKRTIHITTQPRTSTTKIKLKNTPKTAVTDVQDTKELYGRFRNRYDTNPPRDQVRGIWRFINQIKNPDVAKHLQQSLVISLPEYVKLGSKGRMTTQINGVQRIFITISGKVTWKMFSEAFDKYAASHLKE